MSTRTFFFIFTVFCSFMFFKNVFAEQVNASSSYDGRVVFVEVQANKVKYHCSLTAQGELETMDLTYQKKKTVIAKFYIQFREKKAVSVQYMVRKKNKSVLANYSREDKVNETLFQKLDALVNKVMTRWSLKNLAQKLAKEKKRHYLKKQKKEKELEKNIRKTMGEPEKVLDKILEKD